MPFYGIALWARFGGAGQQIRRRSFSAMLLPGRIPEGRLLEAPLRSMVAMWRLVRASTRSTFMLWIVRNVQSILAV